MIGLFQFVGRFFPSKLVAMPEDAKARCERHARQVVARNAEGSVRLSQAQYRTAEQIQADFDAISKVSF